MTRLNFPHHPIRLLILAGALMLGVGCSNDIGSECETDAECPTGAVCDNTVRDGYCLIPDCERGECPEGSVCVQFDRETSFCMHYCVVDDECRDGYVCREDVGPASFCYVPGPTS